MHVYAASQVDEYRSMMGKQIDEWSDSETTAEYEKIETLGERENAQTPCKTSEGVRTGIEETNLRLLSCCFCVLHMKYCKQK